MSSKDIFAEMFGGTMNEDEIANMEVTERIKKKETELQKICSRIELMEKERELDEKIKKANDIECFLKKTATARTSDYEKESGIYLTTDDVEKAFEKWTLAEDGKKLFRFAMRIVAEENMNSRLCNVELAIYFAHDKKVTITKGDPKQKMFIFYDEKNEPAFRCEISNHQSLQTTVNI